VSVLDKISGDPSKKLTVNVSQNFFRVPMDLIHKTELYFDQTINDYLGLYEYEIKSIDDIVYVCKIVEKERTTRATDMNAESSRVHCMMNAKLYQLTADKKMSMN
jgi:hypothetical protein